MSLLSFANYCAYTNTSLLSNNATLITNLLIPTAEAQVEKYCDRIFESNQYNEWTNAVNAFNLYYPKQYPVTRLYSISLPDSIGTITNIGTTPINVIVDNESVNVFDPIINVGNDYLYTVYNNVSSIITQVEIDNVNINSNIDSKYNLISSSLLQPTTYLINPSESIELKAAISYMNGKMKNNGIMLAGEGNYINNNPNFNYNNVDNSGNVCIVYQGGYNPIPLDLQWIIAQIVADILNQSLNGGNNNGGLKSESIDQYSYTIMDNINLAALIQTKYKDALMSYRRNVFA